MSITPSKFLIQDPMPSLGALVREAIQPKPCPIEAFEIGQWGIEVAPGKFLHHEGVVYPPVVKRVASTPAVVAGKFKVGDRVRCIGPLDGWYGIGDVGVVTHLGDPDGLWVKFDPSATVESNTGDRGAHAQPRWLELIPPAVTPDDGWIEWKGGECPVPDARVLVRFRNGNVNSGGIKNAVSWEWDWSEKSAGNTHDITAYRVVQP